MSTLNVIFNLSDTAGAEIVAPTRVKDRLRKRGSFFSGLEVLTYDLWALLRDEARQNLPITDQPGRTASLDEIRRACRRASKVIIACHGPRDAVTYGVVNDSSNALPGRHVNVGNVANTRGPTVRVGDQDMARLLGRFLDRDHSYYITLLICYAARSANSRVDHSIAGAAAVDWASSFAYRLFARVCEGKAVNQKMAARTGQAGINEATGKTEVQTEAAIAAEVEYDGLHPADLDAEFNQVFLAAGGAKLELLQRFHTARCHRTPSDGLAGMRRELASDVAAAQLSAQERQLLDGLVRVTELKPRKGEVDLHNGKIIYKYNAAARRVSIFYDRKTSVLGRHVLMPLQTVDGI